MMETSALGGSLAKLSLPWLQNGTNAVVFMLPATRYGRSAKNSVIGLTNRLIAPWVQRAYTAFPESEKHFKQGVILRAGVPIRGGFGHAAYLPQLAAPRVLVLGGSQGAKSLNEAVPLALAQAATNITVVHQCGAAHAGAANAPSLTRCMC